MRALADALPQSQFAVIPDCGHMAPAEDPVQVNRVIRRFLDSPTSS
jgi:pimeloyl-ACP methyl ester carboxylesterase